MYELIDEGVVEFGKVYILISDLQGRLKVMAGLQVAKRRRGVGSYKYPGRIPRVLWRLPSVSNLIIVV